jgi:phage terminase small subunit
MSKLTNKQEAFCQEYIIDLNATQAAIRAGYSEKTAKEQGCQNLTKLNVQERVQELLDQRTERTQIDADYVLSSLKQIADEALGMERYSDANRSLELLGKHLKLFTDRMEVKGNMNLTDMDDDDLDRELQQLESD